MKKIFIFVIIVSVFATSCTYLIKRQISFDFPPQGEYKILQKGVVGESCASYVLGIYIGGEFSVIPALQNAVAQVPGGDALANFSLDYGMTNYFVYWKYCAYARGDVIKYSYR